MSDRHSHLTAEINVTPFLDVLLVLIITFMAAMTARKTMDAQLPLPCLGSCEADGVPIVLEVLRDGSYLLNRHPVAAAGLSSTLHGIFDRRPDKIIHVAGHRDASYQTVLTAMDVSRSAGVRVIALPASTAPRYPSPAPPC
jgi:biopolymer transport protein TolR